MAYYVGIDLGTTNSAICSYDGENVRIWKSPEQNDVTPSAIYIDRRGNKYFGQKAYNQAPYNPKNSATLFKRFMGTNTTMKFDAVDLELTPEECSSEILKVLFGYLPEEIRRDDSTATVITVPAAFNQMKKDATLEAARLAGIGKVALMQEPVAAIMSIMRHSAKEGLFLVYDLGGGTFDVSIAENLGGKVNLLAHGGVEMCGGRDIDRALFSSIVLPWLKEHFDLPENVMVDPKYKKMVRVAQWATERAKIELSSNDTSTVAISEDEIRCEDESGEEIYLDVDITRNKLNKLMDDIVEETVKATRDTLSKSGLTSNDIQRIVFIGGPTNYKPLRDRISEELAIKTDIDVNPMTAVAEGASIFAESVEWSDESHNRKASNETIITDIDLSFKYTARTPNDTATIMCVLPNDLPGYTIQFESTDTGWISGEMQLTNKLMTKLPLSLKGDNRFKVTISDSAGRRVDAGIENIVVTRTLATIGAIPASHSIGLEVIDKLGGTPMLDFLVNEGDPLPRKGSVIVKAGQTVRSGSSDSINIKLWEGNIQTKIEDNRFIGVLKIRGTDIDYGTIPTGADIECEYEISDSGNIVLSVSIPCIGATFAGQNFYSRQEGQESLDPEVIAESGRNLIESIDDISGRIEDPELDYARKKAHNAAIVDSQAEDDEVVQKANNDLLEAKKTMNSVRKNNQRLFREVELHRCVNSFEYDVVEFARPEEINTFENLHRTAQRAIDNNDPAFDNIISEMWTKSYIILLRQDWFVVEAYRNIVMTPSNFIDKSLFYSLKQKGDMAISRNDMQTLRDVYFDLLDIKIKTSDNGIFDVANIVKR